jgi:hypothetical protein
MISVGRDKISVGGTKHYGLRWTDYLTDVLGNTTTISGTPTVNGVNCTVTHITTSGGITKIRVVPSVTPPAGATARAEAQVTATLSDGEVIPVKIDLDVV